MIQNRTGTTLTNLSQQQESVNGDKNEDTSNIRKPRVSTTTTYSEHFAPRSRENSMNLSVLLICGLFIVCLAPRFPGYYYYNSFEELNKECSPIYLQLNSTCSDTPEMTNETLTFDPPKTTYPQVLWAISPISNLGLLINSAANWIIYIYAGSRFRKMFTKKLAQIFCILCKD